MPFLDFGSFGPLIGDAAAPFALIQTSTIEIGTLVPDVVVEYTGHDETTIVNQPVQTGATITDHAFQNPATIRLVCGWSNATGGAGPGYSEAWYATAQALQQARQPFSVTTPQREYDNMLVASISKSTNQETAHSLMLIVDCQQVIIVDVGGTSSGAVPTGSPADQSNPQVTQAPVSGGSVNPTSSAGPPAGVGSLQGPSTVPLG